jgi:N-acetylglucosamine kinase-like BadF-type ATPase
MYDLFCKELNLAKLEDIIEFYYVDKFIPMRMGDYARIIFQAANQGDRVALQILKTTGRQVGHEAVTCMRALFQSSDEVNVVLGGSVFQRGENPTMIRTLTEYIRKRFPNASVATLKNEPCLGALLWSMDRAGKNKASIRKNRRLASSFSRVFKEFHKRETP